jgi:predicted transposase/invertase (TIGR01784 family)
MIHSFTIYTEGVTLVARQQLIRFDWAVKKLLRSKANFGILEGFLSELLKFNLTILEVIDSESNQNNKDNKFNRVDILVKLDSNEIVLVEIQVDSEPDYFCRMLFGTAKVITEHIRTGDEYINVKKVYSVNILYFDLGHGDDYIYHGTTNFIGTHTNNKLELSDKQQQLYKKDNIQHIYPEYYLIKVNQFNDIAKDTLDEWIYFLKHETIKDSFKAKGLAEAREKLDSMKLSKEEIKEYDRYMEDIRYRNSMVSSNFSMGKIEGKIEGIAIGEERGIQKGIQEERIRAEKEKAKLIKNLLASGVSVEQVVMAANVPPDEVEKVLLMDV